MRCVEGTAPYIDFIKTTINRKREGAETLPYMDCADRGGLICNDIVVVAFLLPMGGFYGRLIV